MNKKKYWPLIVVIIIGTLLRFYRNTDISLWHDEAFSALMIRYGWMEMFRRLALDVHPPMYYILLRFWHYIFGDKLLSLRGFSVLFGVLTIWITWVFVKYAFKSETIALWAAILVSFNPFQLQYVTEARMYTMGAFFSVLTAYFLVRALREQKQFYEDQKLNMPNLPKDVHLKKSYLWHYVWFTVCAGIIDLTHYYLLFTMAALCFYGLVYHIYHYRQNYRRYLTLVLSYLGIIVLFFPWLRQFLFQYKQVQASYWIPPMDIWSIPGTLWTMLLGIGHDNSNSFTLKMMVVVFLFCLFFAWQFIRKTQYFEKWLVLLATVAPFFGAILFVILSRLKGSSSSVYEERYFLFSSTFFIIALSVWLSQIKPKWLSFFLFALYAIFNIYGFFNYWQGLDIATKPGMNGAAKFLGANVAAGDHVFVGSSYEFFNYKYYDFTYYPLPKGVNPLLYTNGRSSISQMSSVEGLALLSNQDLLPNFSAAVHSGDTIWLLWTDGFGSSRPQLPNNWVNICGPQQSPPCDNDFPDVRPWVGTNIYVTEYKVN
jgi:mannosyltransferase